MKKSTVARWSGVIAMLAAAVPATAVLSTVTAPAAGAAAACTGTVAVVRADDGSALGQVLAPGGPFTADGFVAASGDATPGTQFRLSRGAGDHVKLSVVGGSPLVARGTRADFSADRPDFASFRTGDGFVGPVDVWTLDGSALMASWRNSDGTRVPLRLFSNSSEYGDDVFLGAAPDLARLQQRYPDESFSRVTFALDPDEGADCTFTDVTAPSVTLDSGAANGATVDTAPTYTFSSTDADLDHFECALDGGAWETCSSPATPVTYSATNHTFAVRAVDIVGNAGVAVTDTWTLRNERCDRDRARLERVEAKLEAAEKRLRQARASGKQNKMIRARIDVQLTRDSLITVREHVRLSCS